ncbi:hypothetical protein GCM10028825_13800 [Spirosoma agri]|uniref:Uncharacterized protein n=1 Tax=Spirosoma agri TaxID=1987381 RepID=A0A6M0IG66_9BACT|nr:hypothetical protein [Spirosoma agri]
MRLTWTFFSKQEPTVTLTVVYLPKLDKFRSAGYLETVTNTAYVGWDSFRIFNTGGQADKKALFGSLIRVDQFSPLSI